jgi:hypothetical protein
MRRFFFFALLFGVPFYSDAAYLYFDPPIFTLNRGDTAAVSLRIDTDEGECINAVDATISYEDGIRPVDVSRGESILNLWLEEPVIHEDTKTITFAAGITGGYCGRAVGDPGLSNTIATLIFQSPGFAIGGGNNKNPKISITEASQVLLNDGFGTEATLRRDEAVATLSDTPGSERSDTWITSVREDTVPPSEFQIALERVDTAFSGSYFITWNSLDKQTGIDHYEVMEEPLDDFYSFTWGRADAPWVKTESPYVLKDQTLNSTIRIKAIDKAGNETISVLVPDQALRSLSQDRLITYIFIGSIILISLLIIAYALIARKRRIIANLPDA